jgi:hypothetical protein
MNLKHYIAIFIILSIHHINGSAGQLTATQIVQKTILAYLKMFKVL